ncbi:EAL domain-containing protein [Cereibacter changlensis]|uniref:EAL domain-containing protein n=1 Tax=Cereibacter changlensis TaxID=402884 RepID=A0A4U0YWD3_9RHOB|nr:EAL domain-containing protein [Cereibacter changlensis]TKA96105.1 EAL domain-containing protein [Cereibacter changlensis]
MTMLKGGFPAEAAAQLFHDHPHPMWIHDTRSLGILEVNAAGLAQYGYDREAFLALTLADLCLSPEAGTSEPQPDGLPAIESHRRSSGEVFSAEVHSQAIQFDGRPARLVTVRDVTGTTAARDASGPLAESLYSVLLGMADGLMLLDGDWRLSCVNPAAAALLGRRLEELEGRIFWTEFPDLVGSSLDTALHEARQQRQVRRVTLCLSDSGLSLSFTAQPGGEALALYFRDISDEVRAKEQRRLIDLAVSRLNDVVMITEAEASGSGPFNQIRYVNDAVQRLTGFHAEELIGQTPKLLQGPRTAGPELDKLHEALRNRTHARVELVNYTRTGTPYWVEISLSPVFDAAGTCTNFISVERDITARKNAERSLQLAASRDSLTGLLNRASLMDALRQDLSEHQADGRTLALIFIDCDNFKTVNDTLGHAVGDALLSAVAFRLTEVTARDARLARIGGDEFVVLAPVADQTAALRLAEQLREAILAPFLLEQERISVTASIGLAISPGDGDTADQLMQNADIAMFHSKAAGRNEVTRFDGAMQVAMARQAGLTQALQRSLIERSGFRLLYQPQFALDGMQLIGAEALLRWRDAERGEVDPGEFIPAAEKAGLIRMLDRMVIDLAAARLASWSRQGHGLKISVNLSPLSLRLGELASYILDTLAKHSVPPGLFGVEITENMSLDYLPAAMNNLQQLRDAGVSVAIDDFGTGHSSLSHLQRLPVDVLKIDRSFIQGLSTQPERDAPLVTAMLAMAHALKLQVVAEGVETEAELAWLAAQGAEMVQGFWTGKPVTAEEFARTYWPKRDHDAAIPGPRVEESGQPVTTGG